MQNDTKAHKSAQSYTKLEELGVNQAVFRGVIFRGLRVWCYLYPKGRELLTNWKIGVSVWGEKCLGRALWFDNCNSILVYAYILI